MQAKNFYTEAELVKSNTTRIISIYNRTFNTNAFEEWFNPYEKRGMMIVLIIEAMIAYEITLLSPPDVDAESKPYKAVKVIVTPNGWAVVWQGIHARQAVGSKRAISDDHIRLMRNLRQDGESYVELEATFGMKASMVGKICRFERFAEVQ
jgi:hypothetical protein